ncbi:MAG: hypothetical protein HKN25_14385 [Pyrinomonadaceae bacterium]|nr:hypothetical protein [Pyrinomonadaceae bacterium]
MKYCFLNLVPEIVSRFKAASRALRGVLRLATPFMAWWVPLFLFQGALASLLLKHFTRTLKRPEFLVEFLTTS